MSERPRVTLALPVFNGAAYIRETLESALAQTYEDFELIVSDNGSEDGTQAIVAEFAARDDRVRLQVHASNIGAHNNYNSIVPLARGALFKWMAHDDLMSPTFLERCVAELDNRPDVVLVYTATTAIDGTGSPIRELVSSKTYDSDSPYKRLRAYVGDRVKYTQIFGVMRTETIRSTPLLHSFPISDFTFLEEMALRGKFLMLEERLFQVRQHPDRYSAQSPVAQVQWFDPTRSAPMMVTWLRFKALLSAIWRVRMNPADKAKCFAFAAYWAVRHSRAFGSDIWRRLRYTFNGIASGEQASYGRPEEPATSRRSRR